LGEAVKAARENGNGEIIILKCTSTYPANPLNSNVRAVQHIRKLFGCEVGLSDHTLGIAVPVASVALGACLVEKHLTLSRNDGGPDAAFSLNPDEFRAMAEAIRTAQKAIGKICYEPTKDEEANRKLRRSLYVVKDMAEGEQFSENNLRSIRPGLGLHTRYFSLVLGCKAAMNIEAGTPLDWKHVGTCVERVAPGNKKRD
jgi:N-acetylneuraminate synthase